MSRPDRTRSRSRSYRCGTRNDSPNLWAGAGLPPKLRATVATDPGPITDALAGPPPYIRVGDKRSSRPRLLQHDAGNILKISAGGYTR